MACFDCKTVLLAEALAKKAKCDTCKNIFCQTCSELNSSEIKVMQLVGRRTLKFICKSCDCADKTEISDISVKLLDLRNELNTEMNSLSQRFANEFRDMKEEITTLRESNIELVHLLTSNSRFPFVQPKVSHTVTTTKEVNPSFEKFQRATNLNTEVSSKSNPKSPGLLPNHKVADAEGTVFHNTRTNVNKRREVITKTNVNLPNEKDNEGFHVVKGRRKKMMIGEGEGNENLHGKSETSKKIWLFLSRVPDNINEDNIKFYIKTKTTDDSIDKGAIIVNK